MTASGTNQVPEQTADVPAEASAGAPAAAASATTPTTASATGEQYMVLARKLRPQRFDALVGQDLISRILLQALRQERTAHAYLFAGSRGTGKTSTARIFTRALNCLDRQQGEPCNRCVLCLEILKGSCADVYEIDAASNRGIDSIRELRENANYTPARCAYKVYIIDEAHMLTQESFNALLKTLEEPPAHIKFILATTNPQKIPETIQSRCQRFDFQRIGVAAMKEYLTSVAEQEQLTLSAAGLDLIVRRASGGMRDALMALDQVRTSLGKTPSDAEVASLLGLVENEAIVQLLLAIVQQQLEPALLQVQALLARGEDAEGILQGLLETLKDLSLYQALSRESPYFQDHPPGTLDFYAQQGVLAESLLQQLFYLFLELEQQVQYSAHPQACFEMTLAKACALESLQGLPELLGQARRALALSPAAGGSTPAARRTRPAETVPATAQARRSVTTRPAPTAAPTQTTRPAPTAAPTQTTQPDPPPAQQTSPPEDAAHQDDAPSEPPASPPASTSASASSPAPTASDSGTTSAAAAASSPAPTASDSGTTSAAAAASASSDAPTAAALLAESSLCEHPLFKNLLDALQAQSASHLHQTLCNSEILEIQEGRLILRHRGMALTAAQQKQLKQIATPILGEPLTLKLEAIKTGQKLQEAHTVHGRERLEQAKQLEERQAHAVKDKHIQRFQEIFPETQVMRVDLTGTQDA